MQLETPIETIKGVGPKTGEKLHASGIDTVEDILYFLPRKYEDYSHISPIATIQPGQVSIKARAEQVRERRVRRGMHLTEAVFADDSGKVRALWFNQSYRVEQLKSGGEFFVSGTYQFQRNRYLLLNPSVEKVTDLPVQTSRVLPVYKEVKGIRSHLFRNILQNLRPFFTVIPESLPEPLIKQQKLLPLSEALYKLHFPEAISDEVDRAKERIAFEEVFVLQLASLLNKQANAKLESWHIPFNEKLAKEFVAKLPFQLTDAQRKAVWEIVKDFEAHSPMNRMLQGDVGSGKTVVAGMAAVLAASQGYQTAFLAPTELLAIQHANTLHNLLKPFNIEVALLVGSTKAAAKRALKQNIASGSVAIVVGTHALLQEDVVFHKLGFVVIDEQHRFGVKQRQALLQKSECMPHLLSMTATPIPRSLALTVYGELDLSILNERPKGRKPIITELHSPNSRAQMYQRVDDEIEAGRQIYVVCPLIDESPDSELRSVTAEYQRLQQTRFKHRRIGLLHGQMKSDEKDAVMKAFAGHELDILVATTVVEVGVDVPNASVMIIEGADRFGLAQLHQLRGRVGRSDFQSYCFLVPSSSRQPSQRLKELTRSNDGFYLAEVDLTLRGPGEIYGRAQHGKLNLRVASLGDTKLIKRARDAAEQLLEKSDNLLKYKQLAKRVAYYQRLTTLN